MNRPPYDPNLPLVTVVIPCFNHGRFLPDAIESCLAQTYPNLEILVIDDGSSDATAEVANGYGEPVRLIQQQNSGLSASRNTGIRQGKGEILAFLDADDRIDADLIEKRIQPMLADPEVGMSAGWFRFTDENLVPWPDAEQAIAPSDPTINEWTALHFSLAANLGLLVRRRAFELCGTYDPLLRACEDWDFQIRMVRKFKHAFDPVPRADYRQLQKSMSRDPIRMFDNGMAVLRKNRAYTTSPLKYLRHAAQGIFNHTRGSILARGNATTIPLSKVFVARPLVFMIYLVWIIGRTIKAPFKLLRKS